MFNRSFFIPTFQIAMIHFAEPSIFIQSLVHWTILSVSDLFNHLFFRNDAKVHET